MANRTPWPVIAGVVAVVALVLFVSLRWLQPEDVLAYRIAKEDVVATLTVTGEVRADSFANVGAPVAARIVKVMVDDGDVVRKNQVLIELEPDEALARVNRAHAALRFVQQGTRAEELARSEAAYEEAQTGLQESKAALKASRATLAEAERNAQRFEVLYKDEVVSAQEHDAALTQRNVAREETSRLQASVVASRKRLTQSEQQLAQARRGPTQPELDEARAALGVEQAVLNDRFIKSNLNGVVLARLSEPGEMAQPGAPLLRIADKNTLEVIAFVEEVDLPRVAVGDTAHMVLDALPEKSFEGKIIRIGSEVNPANGTVEVRIKLSEMPEAVALLPGMTTDVNIVTDQLKDAVVVPASAVGKDAGRYIVYKFSGGGFKQLPVSVERISLEYFKLSGEDLKPGDWIARFASLELLTKKNVKPMETALESKKPIKK